MSRRLSRLSLLPEGFPRSGPVPPQPLDLQKQWQPPHKNKFFNLRWTSKDFAVLELDYGADPEKNEAWAAEQLRDSGSMRAFRREYCRDWSSAAGDSFYPEVDLFEPEELFREAPGVLPDEPIIRGWDFGRFAACVWFQYSPSSDRVWILRELMTEGLGADSFRDLVMYLSGQIEKASLDHKAISWVQRLQRDSRYPPPPWFEATGSPLRFVDFSGHEATQERMEVATRTREKSSAQILAAAGIHLIHPFVEIAARENVMRRLLKRREDGYPGIIFSPWCPLLGLGMRGGIAYPEATKSSPEPDKPHKDGFYEHLHDAIGYGLVNVVPAAPPKNPKLLQPVEREHKVAMPDRSIVTVASLEQPGEFHEVTKPRFPRRWRTGEPAAWAPAHAKAAAAASTGMRALPRAYPWTRRRGSSSRGDAPRVSMSRFPFRHGG